MSSDTGYFDILNGCAGDMLAGSIIDAGLPLEELRKELRKIPVASYRVEAEKVLKKTTYGHSLEATQFRVIPGKKWDDSTSYAKITGLIDASTLSVSNKNNIKKVFDVLARAESSVHRESIEDVHFHQVGQVDAIVEVASTVIGLDMLGAGKVYCSSPGVAKPAPATLEMLKGLPVIMKSVDAEIITPTGTALIRGLCSVSENLPGLSIDRVGYGAGEMDLPYANVVKFFLCSSACKEDSIILLQTNIDDMSPLLFENLFEKLFASGALDVSVYQGIGKKNRPVFNLQVMLPENLLKEISEVIFRETTTLGVRYRKESREVLKREEGKINTKWGEVRVKKGYMGDKQVNVSPEYSDCKKIADKYGVPLKMVFSEISKIL